MCGICGYLDLRQELTSPALQATAEEMTHTLYHRGPDDGGVWIDERAGVALGSRRLAIVDLSPDGHQPMFSRSERYVVAFNGEIYNFRSLRRTLELETDAAGPVSFRGHSDTEVLLAAVERWGLENAVTRFVGMFAFVIWDRQEQRLSLGRDRLGEKPLYYGWCGDLLLFGSELKALRAHPAFHSDINRHALVAYLRFGYIPAPASIYEGVFKLPPGTILSIDGHHKSTPDPVPYWSIDAVVQAGADCPFSGTVEEAREQLDGMLRNSIREQMVADVPVGALLSGGIDSSTVVALMQAEGRHNVRTFTIGFEEARYNEANHARVIAQQLATDHTELYVTPRDAMEVIPDLPGIYDEPFADSSQIPTYLVSRLAREHVTVALSGDGGDELFGGYERYAWGNTIWSTVERLPIGIRRAVAGAVQTIPSHGWEAGLRPFRTFLPDSVAHRATGEKLHRLASFMKAQDPGDLYKSLMSSCDHSSAMVIGTRTPLDGNGDHHWEDSINFVQSAMSWDAKIYLPDDILTKVDRASMAVSLEVRAPFLDHRVFEFAWQLPLSMKVRDGQSKWLLRQMLYGHLPRELVERPKAGFGAPIGSWLRGPLREWAESLLDEQRLRDDGFFEPCPIRQRWQEHCLGVRPWHYYLWSVLMFQAWLDAERAGVSQPCEHAL